MKRDGRSDKEAVTRTRTGGRRQEAVGSRQGVPSWCGRRGNFRWDYLNSAPDARTTRQARHPSAASGNQKHANREQARAAAKAEARTLSAPDDGQAGHHDCTRSQPAELGGMRGLKGVNSSIPRFLDASSSFLDPFSVPHLPSAVSLADSHAGGHGQLRRFEYR